MARGFEGETVEQESRGYTPETRDREQSESVEQFNPNSNNNDRADSVRSGLAAMEQAKIRQEQRNALMQQMGITEDNPYGFQNRFAEATGLDAKNLSYANLMSLQQRQGIMQLTLDRYLDPMSEGQLRPGMRSGDITQYGIVQSVPKAEDNMNMAEKLLSNNMLGNMLGIGQELRLTDAPQRTGSMIPASASVAGEDPRYTSSGAYKVETPEFLQNTMDSITSGIGSLREKFNRPPEFDVGMDADATVSYTPGQQDPFASRNLGVGRDKEARTYNPAQELRDKYSGTMNAESTNLAITPTDVKKIQEEINRRNKLRNDAILQGASPAEATLVSDLSIGDLLKRGVDSTTDFLNIPNSDNFNPNNPSITPYLKSPDLDGSGGNTMGVNFKFPFYG